MVNRLGVQEFMVITGGGIPVFHYSRTDSRKLDELLSGFLTAITSFASEFGERSIQRLSFEGSELLYEQFNSDTLFIFLVDTGASEKILRTILRELSQKFTARYEAELKMDILIQDLFIDFKDPVRNILKHYDEVLLVTSNLSQFVVPVLKKDVLDIAIKSGFLDVIHRDIGGSANKILDAIDGKTSVYEMSRNLGFEEQEFSEVIEYLALRGFLQVTKMCPLIHQNDERFNAYLDLVGLPNKDYQLLERAKNLCNGNRPITEVSEKLGVTSERLYEVLEKLGDEVEWNLLEISGLEKD
ncbi:MAG: hypothetical protein ACW97A_01880 [Candidatus Thorarchaeota archaeon]